MSDRDPRHRSQQRASTPLSGAGDAINDQLSVIGRSSAVLAVSGGLIATGLQSDFSLGSPASTVRILDASLGNAPAEPVTQHVVDVLRRSGDSVAHTPARQTPRRAAATAVKPPKRARAAAVPKKAKPAAERRAASAAKASRSARPGPTKAATAGPFGTPVRKTFVAEEVSHPNLAKAAATERTSAPAKRHRHIKVAVKKQRTVLKPPALKPPAPKPRVTSKPRASTKPGAATKPRVTTKPSMPSVQQRASARGSSVLAVAARYAGTPYLYGGMSPRGFDCSGYTGHVLRQLGISLPRTANQQMHATRRISRSQARAGDLVFFVSAGRAYHVGIYVGGGTMYDSPRPGRTVGKHVIWDAAVVYGRVTRG